MTSITEPEGSTKVEQLNPELQGIGRYEFGWADSDVAGAAATRGLNEDIVRDISSKKSEPQWMLDVRLKALRVFGKKPMPNWGSNLEGIHFDNIKYFVRSSEKQAAKARQTERLIERLDVVTEPRKEWQLQFEIAAHRAAQGAGGVEA